jgi:Spo0E like sporulation regulatory protein
LEAKRKQMIEVGMQLGLSNPETLRLSQEIDTLHSELIRINCKESWQPGNIVRSRIAR